MHIISNVPYIDQSVRYPTGCESVSTVMLLQYLGFDLSVDQFIEHYLELSPFCTKDGIRYGADPNRFFCGSPYDPDSFGCYAPVICHSLERILGESYCVKNETHTPMEKLLTDYIDRDLPVIFWASINMREPIIGPSWHLHDTNQTFTWISNEHCLLLIGYDEDFYYFNDPYENHGRIAYPRAVVEDRHRAQYEMAVGVTHRF